MGNHLQIIIYVSISNHPLRKLSSHKIRIKSRAVSNDLNARSVNMVNGCVHKPMEEVAAFSSTWYVKDSWSGMLQFMASENSYCDPIGMIFLSKAASPLIAN